jgi:hypothetical protein
MESDRFTASRLFLASSAHIVDNVHAIVDEADRPPGA